MKNLLIQKARKQDKEAFGRLMKQYGAGMYKVAKAILGSDEDVADAMQETALTCWEKLDRLKRDEYFKTWMTRILINHCNKIYGERKRTIVNEELLETGVQEDQYQSIEWKEFLSCLDEKYRAVAVLYYVEGFKTREIAEILDLNASTVRGRLAEARKRLKKQWRDG